MKFRSSDVFHLGVIAATSAILYAAMPATAQTFPTCPETNGVKWLQRPDLNSGIDVGFFSTHNGGVVLADDFKCTTSGAITDIHIWGAWAFDVPDPSQFVELGIWSDIPASATNAYSRPGTLLWTQTFTAGQYTISPYTNAPETSYAWLFFPGSMASLGDTTNLTYLCFYPTNPFVQTGSISAPTNYWLSVYAPPKLHWKSSVDYYNDTAVAGNWPGANWITLSNPTNLQPLSFSFKITTATNEPPPPPPCCPETNGVKWVQRPDLDSGIDISSFSTHANALALADDFRCTNNGPITDIHLWGSWTLDMPNPSQQIVLGIWSDIPADSTNFSHPGTLLWTQTFTNGQYTICYYTNAPETVYGYVFFPGSLSVFDNTTNLYYLCFYPTIPFVQAGSVDAPTNYWLSVSAPPWFNWKSSVDFYNDRAVAGNAPGAGWLPISDPTSTQPFNFAFKITTGTNEPPPPPDCVETNGTKYVQWPDLNGSDVWNSTVKPPGVNGGPWVLADDFTCTNTGSITDIHIWGSWLYDQVLTNSLTFWLGIYDDVPASPVNPFSHPGNLRWQQYFGPGQYSETFWGFGDETFLDPGPPQIVGIDHEVWYYCFFPTNPFVQQGSITSTQIYWLVVHAQSPAGTAASFGWKTTTNVQHDISVHALWPGAPPPPPTPWFPTFRSAAGPTLDLAFKITTDTNRCPIPVTCSTNKTVQCGTNWVFDPPLVGPDPCCPIPPLVTFSATTNVLGPCQQIITGAWVITDCLGTMVTCTQVVTVVDSLPPILICGGSKSVPCGSNWQFDLPTAFDLCCGTNVSILEVSTVTNNIPCPVIITRTWRATDCCSNNSICSQAVTLVDTNPPTIICPTNILIKTCDTNSVMVSWSIMASDVCGSVTVTSTPPSGSLFTPNTTNTVIATARDDCGNTNTCAFTVTVIRPALSPVTISYLSTDMVVLTWTEGILQSATNVIGPYVDVGGATSPYTNTIALPMKYYRLRCVAP